MKRLFIFVLAAFLSFGARADDDAIVAEIMERYDASLAKAKEFCPGLDDKMDSVRIAIGIIRATGAVGTVAGGVGAIAGVVKKFVERETGKEIANGNISELKEALEEFRGKELNGYKGKINMKAAIKVLNWEYNGVGVKEPDPKEAMDAIVTFEKLFVPGNIRTGAAFTSGGLAAGGTIASFAGVATLDKLMGDMKACDSYVREIEGQRNELTFASPGDPTIPQMNKIIESCNGMSPENIVNVKGRLVTAGVISAIGAAAGITGGITSAIAVKKDKDPNNKDDTSILNKTADISSVVAAAGNFGGAMFSKATLHALDKNSEIAERCAKAF